eukprot:scaffold12020_cov122-Isochrysis_galbana.AAC.1
MCLGTAWTVQCQHTQPLSHNRLPSPARRPLPVWRGGVKVIPSGRRHHRLDSRQIWPSLTGAHLLVRALRKGPHGTPHIRAGRQRHRLGGRGLCGGAQGQPRRHRGRRAHLRQGAGAVHSAAHGRVGCRADCCQV